MPSKRRDLWGFAVGLDRGGERRRVTVYATETGFDFVGETLFCHSVAATGKPNAERLRGEIAAAFGLTGVKFEFPHLGIFASTPEPTLETRNSGLSTRRFSNR